MTPDLLGIISFVLSFPFSVDDTNWLKCRAFVINSREQLRAIEAVYPAVVNYKKTGGKEKKDKKDKDNKKDQKPKKALSGSLVNDIKGDTSG